MLKPGIIKGGCRAWPVLALSTLLFLFLFSGFAAAQTGTTISLIQTAGSTSDSASSTVSQGFGVNNTAGNLIVVAVSWGDNPAVSLSASDTLGNTYFVATNDFDPGNRQGLAIIYAPNIRGGANIVTVNFGQADGYRRIIVSEYSGIATTSPLDAAAKHKATGTTATNGVTSTAANTITNGDLIFGVVMDDSGFFGTITAGTGFTRRAFVNNMDLATEDTVQAAAGPIAATFTFSRADTYLAQMAAFKAGGGSADTTPPTAPSNLVATAASGAQINLSWTASTDNVGVTGYRVERCQGAGCSTFVQIATPTGTTYGNTGLAAGTPYSYRVRATDAAGNLSDYSNTASATTLTPDTQPPTSPSNLAATAASSGQINLSWTASTDNVGVTGYLVERCQGAGCSTFAQIGSTASTAYGDAGLSASTAYSYRVRATDAAGNLSGYSNVASATTPSVPFTPTFMQGNYATPQSAASSVTVTYTAAQWSGDLNVVVVGWNDANAGVTSVVDTKRNVYAVAAGPAVVSGGLSQTIYYASNIANANASENKVTVTFTAAAQYPDIRILEYRGIAATSPVDVAVAGTGTSNSSSDGPVLTTNGIDLLIGANIVQALTTGPGARFTTRMLTSPD